MTRGRWRHERQPVAFHPDRHARGRRLVRLLLHLLLHLPILDIRTGDTSISISVTGREHVDDAALSFARELLKAAQDFAAGVERIHAERATAEPAGRAA